MRSLPGAVVVVLLLHAAFFGDVLTGGRTLSASAYVAGLTSRGPGDSLATSNPPHLLDVEGAAWVDEPSPYLARSAFAVGELPLWSSGSGLGAPLAANLNSGAGNPLQLPLNVSATPFNADVFYLGRLVLLALFTWALLRELGVAVFAALLGATIVAYGGYPIAWIAHHPLSSELFLPLMLLGFERGRRGRPVGWRMFVLAAGGSLLGGKLQATLLCFAFAAVWACRRASSREGGVGRVSVLATGLGLALGVGVAAFLLVPAAELMARASGLTLGGRAQLASYTVPWPSLASLAMPGLFVAPGRVLPDGFLTPAIGIVAVVLAGIGAAAQAAPLVRVARLCLLWAGALLLRNAGALGDLATGLPAVRGILFVKYTFTIVFALAIAAAIGFDAVLAGRIEARRARLVIVIGLGTLGALGAVAVSSNAVPTFPEHAPAALATMAAVLAVTLLWRFGVVEHGVVAVVLGALVVVELWSFAPHEHPPRRDPYDVPAFVDFIRQGRPGRVIADADLLVPLTSAAVGLHDLRAIDVLMPGTYYAFFTRLVSFCDRVIHFTVDPDLALAATAPAIDLAGVRYVVSRQALPMDDLQRRVRRQVGHERTARLLAGLVRLRTEGGPLAIGPVTSAGDERFAFTLPTPFTLDVTADSEAPELAWGILVRDAPSPVSLRVQIDGVSSDAAGEASVVSSRDQWQEYRVALARAGTQRRVRVRLIGTAGATPATVSIGNLGFGGGAASEARLASERGARHAAEAEHLRPVFRDEPSGVTVYENDNALSRVFRVRHVEPSASPEAAFTRLGDGFDFRYSALLATSDVLAVQRALGGDPASEEGADAAGTAEIRDETPGVVTIATDGATAGVVVLADLAFPGWRVEIEGQRAPTLTIDGVLRGVVVPAGPHVVTFRYRPTSLLIGTFLSVITLAALLPYGRRIARMHAGDTST